LFEIDEDFYNGVSSTQRQLHELHAAQRKSDETLERHIEFLHALDISGLSDHDLLFSRQGHLPAADDANEEAGVLAHAQVIFLIAVVRP
jgi:hypothetical protein